MMYITNSAVYYTASVILLVLSCDGCYTNYNNCQQQYFTAVSSPASSDPTLAQQQLCGAATTAMTCLDNDAGNCPAGTAEPAGFTQIKTSINQTVTNCEMIACGLKQQVCGNQTLGAQNQLQPPNQGSPDSASIAAFCAEMPIAVDCYRNVQMECPAIDLSSIIQTFSSLVAQTCGGGAGGEGAGGNLNSCFQKVFECANYSTEIANAALNINFTDAAALQSLSLTMCPTFDKITKCYSELTLMCPGPAFANATASLDAVKPMVEQLCGSNGGMQGGCLQKSMECSRISQNLISVDFTDMSAIQTLSPVLCSTMTNLTKCYDELKQACPNIMPANATSPIDALKPMIDPICGAGGNCIGCVTPFMAAGCQNTSTNDYESSYRCCGVAYEMFNCLKRNQCTQMPMFGDIRLFELSLERQCSGYQEYCPGLNACLSPFNSNPDLYEVCSQISSFLTCVNTACKDKPKVGDLTIMKIMPLYQQICTGLSNYPTIATCPTFDTCTKNGVSALVPQPVTLKSISAVGNPEHWCKMAKGISTCVSTATTSCSLGGNSVTDAAALKTSADTICNGVRDACPGVAVCLATLGNGGSLLQSCPNIPAFVTCVTAALNTCGDSSKVKASYSLADIQNLFTQSCAVIPNFESCQGTSICLQMDLPSSPAEITDKISDQTFWCNSLKSILKCTTAYSQPCNQTTTVTQTLNNLLNQVKVHCPDEGDVEEITTVVTTGGDNAGISVESSLMLVLVLSFVTSLY